MKKILIHPILISSVPFLSLLFFNISISYSWSTSYEVQDKRIFVETPLNATFIFDNDTLSINKNIFNEIPIPLCDLLPSCENQGGPSKAQIQSLAIFMGLMENILAGLKMGLSWIKMDMEWDSLRVP